jgi:hypothetical protein
MQLPAGITRPIVAVVIEGPGGRRLLDGLLDTGADRTLFPQREAKALGISLPPPADGSIRTAGGLAIVYRLAEIVLEPRTSSSLVRWRTPVAFTEDPLHLIHLGTRGFLEYFHCTFMGPERTVVLDPRPSLPTE